MSASCSKNQCSKAGTVSHSRLSTGGPASSLKCSRCGPAVGEGLLLPDFFLSPHPGGRVDHSGGPGIRQAVKRCQGEALLFVVLGSLTYLVVVVAGWRPGAHPSSSAISSRAHVRRCSPLSMCCAGRPAVGRSPNPSLDLGFRQ